LPVLLVCFGAISSKGWLSISTAMLWQSENWEDCWVTDGWGAYIVRVCWTKSAFHFVFSD
jgi:hypothetical protein